MGLGLSLATAFLITEGMKNLFGKPRPDLISRCNPDLSRIQEFTVGGYGQPLSDRWVLVSYGICQQTDMNKLDDGFKSFPSGHASCKRCQQLRSHGQNETLNKANDYSQSPGPVSST